LPQLVQLLCGHRMCVSLQVLQVRSCLWCDSLHLLHLYCVMHVLVLWVRFQHFDHCWVGFVLRYSLICVGCPQLNMNLWLSMMFLC
jgi:hypothetical protein